VTEWSDDTKRALLDAAVPGWQEAKLVSGNRRVLSPLRQETHPSFDIEPDACCWIDRATEESGDAWDLAVRVIGKPAATKIVREHERARKHDQQSGTPRARQRTEPKPNGERRGSTPKDVVVLGPATDAQVGYLVAQRRITIAATARELGAKRVRYKGHEDLGIPTLAGGWKLLAIQPDGEASLDRRKKLQKWNIGPASIHVSPSLGSAGAGDVLRLHDLAGESDLMAAVDSGLVHVMCGTTGEGSVAGHHAHRDWLLELQPAEVIVWGDLDDAGKKGAQKRAEWWSSQGAPVRVPVLPAELGPKGDVRDFLLGAPAGRGKAARDPVGGAADLDALADHAPLTTPRSGDAPHLAPKLVRMSDVEPEPIKWLWEPYIALRKITVAEGNPGCGKTFVTLAIAAAITRGWPLPLPDGTMPVNGARTPANVLLMTCEDGLGDTIRPRLDSAKADVQRVFALEGAIDAEGKRRPFTLADVGVLDRALTEVKPALVIIDPIQGFLGADVDMHRANEVRPLLSGLSELAERHNCAVVVIRHLRKSSSDHAVQRGLGSIDFAAAARSILLFAENPLEPGQYVIAHTKSSLAPRAGSLKFSLAGGEFMWAGASELSADDLLRAPAKSETERPRDAAQEWLVGMLGRGPVAVPELRRESDAAGLAWRTVERAKGELGIRSRKLAMGAGWVWEFDPEGRAGDEDRRTPPHRHTEASGGVRGDEPGASVSEGAAGGLRGDTEVPV
jgi:hypothetical protein